LSLVTAGVLVLWLLLYERSDPQTHIGAFYGDSIADWLGSLVAVVATTFWYEKGSVERRRCFGRCGWTATARPVRSSATSWFE
jgi:hypothetical protein